MKRRAADMSVYVNRLADNRQVWQTTKMRLLPLLRPRPHYAVEFKNAGRFPPKNTSNVFRPTAPEEFKNTTSQVILDLCLRRTLAGKSRDYQDYIVVEKFRFQNILRSHKKQKASTFKFLRFKEHFQKAPFS